MWIASTRRVCVLVAAVGVLGSAATACGGSDDDSNAAAPSRTAAAQLDNPDPATRRVRATLSRLSKAYADADARTYCEITVRNGLSRRACEKENAGFMAAVASSGALEKLGPTRVVDVQINGPRATATTTTGKRFKKVRLVKGPNGWQVVITPNREGELDTIKAGRR